MTRWDELVSVLRGACPITRHRLIVKRVRMKDHGRTTLSDSCRTITITVRRQDPFVAQQDSLIHEWGHALAFDRERIHGQQWAKDYAKAYDVLEKFREGNTQDE